MRKIALKMKQIREKIQTNVLKIKQIGNMLLVKLLPGSSFSSYLRLGDHTALSPGVNFYDFCGLGLAAYLL